MPLFKNRSLVGVDIGVAGIKAVELSRQKNPRLLAYNRVPLPVGAVLPTGEIKDRQAVTFALKKLFESGTYSTKRVALGISGGSITIKKISVPRMSPRELEHQLYWEAEQYIPFDVSEANLDFAILGNSSSDGGATAMMDVLIVAAKKDYIASLLSLVQQAGLHPEVVDSQAFALGNTFEFNYGYSQASQASGSANVLLDFGASSTKLTIVEDDKTTFTKEIGQSGVRCTQLISDRLGIDFLAAEKLKLNADSSATVAPVLAEFATMVAGEISRTLSQFLGQNAEQGIQGIYYCGGGSLLEGLIPALEAELSAPVQPLNPVQNISGSGKALSAKAIREAELLGSVAIGLALRRTGDA